MINEPLFQTIMDTIPNPAIITNSSDILKCNQSFLEFFDYKDLSDFFKHEKSLGSLFLQHEDYFSLEKLPDNELWMDYIYNTSKTEKISILNSKGETYFFEININKLPANDYNYIVIFTDITASQHEKKLLEQMAYTDPLTNIYNRQMFSKMLIKEQENKKRHGDALSLIMFDIDHFKAVNDTYGHDVGDTVLITLTKLISNNLRANDIFARWGGEEFIILLPRTNVDVAYDKAQELRELIEKYSDDVIPRITLSLGVTELLDIDEEQAYFKRVDTALYGAKIRRNDVVQL